MSISLRYLLAILWFCVLFASTSVIAQPSSMEESHIGKGNSNKEKRLSEKANKLYDDFSYTEVINELKKKEYYDLEDKIILANAYRLIHDVRNAALWYDKVILESQDPIHYLRYAQVLHALGEEVAAKEQYDRYHSLAQSDDALSSVANTLKENLLSLNRFPEHSVMLKNESTINSENLEFSPTIINHGVLFVSTRKPAKYPSMDKDLWMGENFMSLYWAPLDEISNELKEPNIFSYDITSRYHEGPASFSDKGTEIFFTRNHFVKGKRKNNRDGIMRLQIYSAQLNDDGWTDPVELPFNTDEYEECHPSISSDGNILYFSSDREGGFGGMDIYKVTRQGDQWSEPVNLGANINTTENEVFPLIHKSGVLFFASNGLDGLGGLDIFQSVSFEGKWIEPINLGTPFNSNKDDFGITLNKEMSFGYLTSARDGGLGKDDIYSFGIPETFALLPASLRIYDSIDNTALEGVSVNISNLQNHPSSTPKNGTLSINISPFEGYEINANKDGYDPVKMRTTGLEILSKPESLLNIPMNKAKPKCLALTYTFLDKLTNQPVPLVRVSFNNPLINEFEEKKTDEHGQFHFDCLPCESILNVKASKEQYIESEHSFSAKKIECGFDAPIQKTLFLEKIKPKKDPEPDFTISAGIKLAKGEYMVLDHLYYDYDKSYIRPDAAKELNILIELLTEYPSLVIELGSHTDTRGTAAYNLSLSERRAHSAKQYLIDQGVPENQLKSRGYGESYPRNECIDGIKCAEEQHQYNRRTVAKVLEISKKITVIYEDKGPKTIDRKE